MKQNIGTCTCTWCQQNGQYPALKYIKLFFKLPANLTICKWNVVVWMLLFECCYLMVFTILLLLVGIIGVDDDDDVVVVDDFVVSCKWCWYVDGNGANVDGYVKDIVIVADDNYVVDDDYNFVMVVHYIVIVVDMMMMFLNCW